jgi:hypothetical protein
MYHLSTTELALIVRALETHADVYPDDSNAADLAGRLREVLRMKVNALVDRTDDDRMQVSKERTDAAARAGRLAASQQEAARRKAQAAKEYELSPDQKRKEETDAAAKRGRLKSASKPNAR